MGGKLSGAATRGTNINAATKRAEQVEIRELTVTEFMRGFETTRMRSHVGYVDKMLKRPRPEFRVKIAADQERTHAVANGAVGAFHRAVLGRVVRTGEFDGITGILK